MLGQGRQSGPSDTILPPSPHIVPHIMTSSCQSRALLQLSCSPVLYRNIIIDVQRSLNVENDECYFVANHAKLCLDA